jgi:hypothetical protein
VIPAARRAEVAGLLADKITDLATIDRLAKAAGLAPRHFEGGSSLERWSTVLDRLETERVAIAGLLAGVRKEFPLTASKIEDLLDDPITESAAAATRPAFPRPILVSRIEAPDVPVACIRWPWRRRLRIAIRVGARARDEAAPAIAVRSTSGPAEVAPAEAQGEWWATTASVPMGRGIHTQSIRVTLPGDDLSGGRLIVACRGPSYAASIVLMIAAALCAYVLFATMQATGDSWTAISGVLPLVIGVATAINLARPKLLLGGKLQAPEYALGTAAALIGLAFLPGTMWVAIDNRTAEAVTVDGKKIAAGDWMTGSDGRVARLRERYCVSEPSRRTGRFLDLFLPRAIVHAQRPMWDALGDGFTLSERKSLQVQSGGRSTEADPEVLVDADAHCRALEGAAASVAVADSTILIPHDRRLLRTIQDGVAELSLEAGGSSPFLSAEVPLVHTLSGGTLHCKAAGSVALREYIVDGAGILRLETAWPGQSSSRWTGRGDRAWSCAPDAVSSTKLEIETTGGPVDIVLPTSPGAATVTLDDVSITCHPEAGKLWRVMRRPLAAGSKRPEDPVRFGPASAGTLVVTSDRNAVLCASNDLGSTIVTQAYRIVVGDQVAIAGRARRHPHDPEPPVAQPQPQPVAKFCYYVGEKEIDGPCGGAKCPPGCKTARVSVKMVKLPAGCSQVCACETAPRCLR